MEENGIIITPIERLIAFYCDELFTEIVINKDSTSFWGKARDYLFDNALTSFREGIVSLREGMIENKEMYNYFSAFCFRVFSQPYSDPAINVFCEGFDEISTDPTFFKDVFQWKSKDLGKVEQLLLFLCVHRNKIMLALNDRMEAEAAAAMERKLIANQAKNGRQRVGGKQQ